MRNVKWYIKQACRKGQLYKLIDNCYSIIHDYQMWSAYNGINHFFTKEWYITLYKEPYLISCEIIKYINSHNKIKFFRLNKKNENRTTNLCKRK